MCAEQTTLSASARPPRSNPNLSIPSIHRRVRITGARPIHSRYGFLSEKRGFVQSRKTTTDFYRTQRHNIRIMADKDHRQDTMKEGLGVAFAFWLTVQCPHWTTPKRIRREIAIRDP